MDTKKTVESMSRIGARIGDLEQERDQLREALQELLIASLEYRLAEEDGVVEDARAALKATERT